MGNVGGGTVGHLIRGALGGDATIEFLGVGSIHATSLNDRSLLKAYLSLSALKIAINIINENCNHNYLFSIFCSTVSLHKNHFFSRQFLS